jgi:tetratricopeptide (TPR) repeat protein
MISPPSVAWKLMLGEEPRKAIERFLDAGMLAQASLSEHLAKFTVAELKDMLRERELPLSGRKNDLILRLVQSDAEGMKQAISGLIVLECSEKGREAWQRYQARVNSDPDSHSKLKELLIRWGPKSIKWLKRHLEELAIGGVIGGVLGDLVYDLYIKERFVEREVKPPEPPPARSFPLPTPEPTIAPPLRQTEREAEPPESPSEKPPPITPIPGGVEPIAAEKQLALAHASRGWANLEKGNFPQALVEFSRALELNPRGASYHGRAIAHRRTDNPRQAVADSDKSIELQPQQSSYYHSRGNVYCDLGELQQAFADYNRAIELAPHLYLGYSGRADVYRDLGKPQQALADLNKAIELCPQEQTHICAQGKELALPRLYYKRALVYRDLGKRQQAAADYRKVLELSDNPDLLDTAKGRLMALEVWGKIKARLDLRGKQKRG